MNNMRESNRMRCPVARHVIARFIACADPIACLHFGVCRPSSPHRDQRRLSGIAFFGRRGGTVVQV
jgi:hypothetical protein